MPEMMQQRMNLCKNVPINSSISVKHRHSSGTVTGRNSKNINPSIQKEKEALPPRKQVISGYPYCVRSLQGGGSERKRWREDTNTGAKWNKVEDGRNGQLRRMTKRSL